MDLSKTSEVKEQKLYQCEVCWRTVYDTKPPRCHYKSMSKINYKIEEGTGSLDHIHW